ncbi:efflux RND transporter periplasmic adaptor subunit [Aestuariirhabdus litorea]|uniref:Efflux RND transporter periplasmic adaptor subunit n=1 Tax=Aestuariirhabdus litorea TaxID=2528527 RepID=A0A3P3VIT2_9GAMM|nr:efflux RND transporter periplasmic adaptor subunit [Aestuariirhabdus litorea]RRJ82651.1 efflux RND transporter periplasmic adaptor subunit [Aestuariirhabdus litorea]RWW92812.1 efflux RND transporter periplasmic adaptor subunit [Endozoicomonadaceae bacterium GTF-13]
MNKALFGASIALAIGVGIGIGAAQFQHLLVPPATGTAGHDSADNSPRPLFYRNPMNPAITSPVPAKDEMGMDYIPVYPEKPAADRKPLFYRNPMNPAITSPVPAQDEMGMDYIPVFADEEGGNDEPTGTVKIDPVMVQNIGVRTVKVEQRDLVRSVRASGRITVDESRMSRLHPRTEGWVEKQWVSRIGNAVRKGDDLLSLYSPQLVTSQQEYLLALDNLNALADSPFEDIRRGAEEMVSSSEQRLRLLDMPPHEIAKLRQSRQVQRAVAIESPFDGVVLDIGAREGQYIKPSTEMYMLADLSKVWLLADVYEYELPWISVGDSGSMEITGLGNHSFTGTVAYIYPYAEASTRTVKVRLEFDNPQGLLKPDMFASVTIGASTRKQALVVPSNAIVRSGSREQVFVVRGEGKFEPRQVELGYSSDGWVEITSGLKAGETVVSSALFLIDSESKLREATAKMMEASKNVGASTPEEATSSDELSMGGLSMDDMSMDGMSMEGMSTDDMSMDGMSTEGMSTDDMSMEGMSTDDMSMEGMSMEPDATKDAGVMQHD